MRRSVGWSTVNSTQEGFHAGDQCFGAEGFGDVVVGTQFQADDRVGFFGFGRQHDNREHGGIRCGTHALADFKSIQLGQHQIEHNQVRLLFFDLLQGLDPIHGRDRSKAVLL